MLQKKKIFFLIVVLILLIIVDIGGFVFYNNSNVNRVSKESSNKIKSEDETVNDISKESNNNEINLEDFNEDYDKTAIITKEEAEEFLNALCSEKVSPDLLISKTDEDIFLNSLRYLSINDKFNKDGDQFIITRKDIKDLARKYYMKSNYDYISDDKSFTYDDSSQIYRSGLRFDLFSPGPSFEKTRSITAFKCESGVATLTYNVYLKYLDQATPSEINTDYIIKLYKVNGELRIKGISK